jgi:predicted GIY-YIG superfamily endonuclease
MICGCIYKIDFPNGKIYIGQTINFIRRRSEHKRMHGVGH